MEFTLIHENKLKAILSAEDMRSLDLTYDSMDYADPTTRKAMMYILENARSQVGFDPRKARLFIEVYPCDEGGCVLYFTNLQSSGKGGKPAMEPVLFCFEDAEALIAGACKLFDLYGHRIYKSTLYLMHGAYRLAIYPLDYVDRLSVHFLSEFAQIVGEGVLHTAYAEEHGRVLIRDRAIDVLAEAFGAGD